MAQHDLGNGRAILVLGMHRSGTSSLAGCLQRRGLYLGDVQEANPHNRKGNRESLRIMHLNDAVLAHNDGAWDRPPGDVSWTETQAAERDFIMASLAAPHRAWGFKDPRTLLLLPFWLEGIDDPRFVGTFRHPARVARSLYQRWQMPVETAHRLWHAYNRRLLGLHRERPFPLLSFDQEDARYVIAVDRIAKQLGLRGWDGRDDDFFEPALRTGIDLEARDFQPPAEILRVHDELRERSEV